MELTGAEIRSNNIIVYQKPKSNSTDYITRQHKAGMIAVKSNLED